MNNKLLNMVSEKFLKFRGNKFLVGDFNFPSIDWDKLTTKLGYKSIEQKILNIVNSFGLVQLVTVPTRYHATQKENILDLILAENVDLINDLSVNDPLGRSDHGSLYFNVKAISTKLCKNVHKLNYDKGNYKAMVKYIEVNLRKNYNEISNLNLCFT